MLCIQKIDDLGSNEFSKFSVDNNNHTCIYQLHRYLLKFATFDKRELIYRRREKLGYLEKKRETWRFRSRRENWRFRVLNGFWGREIGEGDLGEEKLGISLQL